MMGEHRIEFSSGYAATLDLLVNTAIPPAGIAAQLELSLESYVSQLRSWFRAHPERGLRVTDNGIILMGLQREEVTSMETPNPTPPETPDEGDQGDAPDVNVENVEGDVNATPGNDE